VRVLDGPQHPPGHLLARWVKWEVHRGHAQVEALEELCRPVHLAVRADVQLGAVQQPHPAVTGLPAAYLGPLASIFSSVIAA